MNVVFRVSCEGVWWTVWNQSLVGPSDSRKGIQILYCVVLWKLVCPYTILKLLVTAKESWKVVFSYDLKRVKVNVRRVVVDPMLIVIGLLLNSKQFQGTSYFSSHQFNVIVMCNLSLTRYVVLRLNCLICKRN